MPFAREQRFRFIEALALWEGAVQRKRVSQIFGIAENHVTKDLKAYEAEHPNNLVFKPRLRAYVPQPKFKPVYASDDPTEYLSLLYAHAESGSITVLPGLGGKGVVAETMPSPAHGVNRAVLRNAVRAIRHECGMKVTYLSMSSDRPVQRTLWPHALVHTGYRWQVRAFDSHREEFRDFVLQRMSKPEEIPLARPRAVSEDELWHSFETADVIPHPKLTEHQQRVVAKDFGMRKIDGDYVWRVSLRQCMVGYFVAKYGFDDRLPARPLKHTIVLRNWEDLRPYFFPDAVAAE